MRSSAPADVTTYTSGGILDFVFAEMWSRPDLDMRSRRWITLACVCAAGTVAPIEGHIYAALKSGDVTLQEINEFVLHFSVYLGWPKSSIIQTTIFKAWAQVEAEGGPVKLDPPAPMFDAQKRIQWNQPETKMAGMGLPLT